MANRAYLGVWLREFSEANLLAHFERFLASAPLSSTSPFTELVVQAVASSETPLAEWDLRGQDFTAADIAQLAREYVHSDTAFVVGARWDLWVLDPDAGLWTRAASPLMLLCQGPEYDSGVCAEFGHLHAELGFEHLFTGHAGVLGSRRAAVASQEATLLDGAASDSSVVRAPAAQSPAEQAFSAWIAQGQHLREYHEKTRENIEQLFSWMRGVEQALPVESMRLWSEGEENFEARLDEILALR